MRVRCGPSIYYPHKPALPQRATDVLWPHRGFTPLRPDGGMRGLGGSRRVAAAGRLGQRPLDATIRNQPDESDHQVQDIGNCRV